MDHRATAEAEQVNATRHRVLSYLGGVISPEMQVPKLMWLKQHRPDTWARATGFFDLSDWLVYRCTGVPGRSVCTLTCKWTFLAHEHAVHRDSGVGAPGDDHGSRAVSSADGDGGGGVSVDGRGSGSTNRVDAHGNAVAVESSSCGWQADFFRDVGLSDLVDEGYARIGRPEHVCPIGSAVGSRLTAAASEHLGLKAGTVVAAGMIDAHAGGLATIAAVPSPPPHTGGVPPQPSHAQPSSTLPSSSASLSSFASLPPPPSSSSTSSSSSSSSSLSSLASPPPPPPSSSSSSSSSSSALATTLPSTTPSQVTPRLLPPRPGGRLALISGTSSCHMAASATAVTVPGVWGPFYSVMLPHSWLLEAGQSAAGALLDHVVLSHPATPATFGPAPAPADVCAALNDHLAAMAVAAGVPVSCLARDVHVYPDFHGNRSPLADPDMRGAVVGLSLDASLDALAVQYLATVQALAFGTRDVLAALATCGVGVDTLVVSGGLAHNPLFLQEHANATGCDVVLPREGDAMVLGCAVVRSLQEVYPCGARVGSCCALPHFVVLWMGWREEDCVFGVHV